MGREETIRDLRQLIGSAHTDTPSLSQDPAPPGSDEIEVAKQRVLRLLAIRARSEEEVRRFLRRHQTSGPVIEDVVDHLREVGLIDDLEFARQWISARAESKSLARSRLRRELVEKAVAGELIDKALAESEVCESESAMKLARQRVRTMAGLDRATMIRRLSAQLARRGFSESVVRHCVFEVVGEHTGGEIGNIADDE